MSRAAWVLLVAIIASIATLIYEPFMPHNMIHNIHRSKHNVKEKLEVFKGYNDIKVVRYLIGESAIEAIRNLHWHPQAIVGIKDAIVAMYSDGSVLWLAYFNNSTIASLLEQKMINAIDKDQGRIPYLKPIPHEGFYIIPDVRGPYHVLLQEGRCLIWLQLGERGVKLLKEIYNFYKPICLEG